MIRDFIAGRAQSLSGGTQETEIGIGGFYLFARVSDSTRYLAQVPTNVLEDGSVATDHIINDPLELTISGEVSDVHVRSRPIEFLPPAIENTVGSISAFLPNRTQAQLSQIRAIGQSINDRINQVDSLISIGRNAFNAFSPTTQPKALREQFVDFIESVYYGKQLISIEMPYRVHESMAITSVSIERDNQLETLRFEISAQKVELVELVYTDIGQFYKAPAPAVAGKTQGASDKGAQDMNEQSAGRKEKSLASALLGR